jgi:hypothetical protein
MSNASRTIRVRQFSYELLFEIANCDIKTTPSSRGYFPANSYHSGPPRHARCRPGGIIRCDHWGIQSGHKTKGRTISRRFHVLTLAGRVRFSKITNCDLKARSRKVSEIPSTGAGGGFIWQSGPTVGGGGGSISPPPVFPHPFHPILIPIVLPLSSYFPEEYLRGACEAFA